MDLQVGIIQPPNSLQELTNSFFQAVKKGQLDKVRELLEMIDVDSQDDNGMTALMIAIGKNREDIVRLLLEYGADVDIKNNTGNTALMRASLRGYINIVRLLLEYRANVDIKNTRYETALMWASLNNSADIVELLLEYGAMMVDIKTRGGNTSLRALKFVRTMESQNMWYSPTRFIIF